MTLVFSIMSCDNELITDENSNTSETETKSSEDIQFFEFTYKCKHYSSEIESTNDSIITFKNKEVEQIANRLKNNHNLITYVYPDGAIEYFDNEQDLKNNIKRQIISTKAFTKVAKWTTSATLTVFQKDKCKGRSYSNTLTDQVFSFNVTHEILCDLNLNDEISSIDLICNYQSMSWSTDNPPIPLPPLDHGSKCIATFYADPNCTGYALWFAVDPSYPHSYIHYFKSYPLYPGSSKNWNDKVSSYTFMYNSWHN